MACKNLQLMDGCQWWATFWDFRVFFNRLASARCKLSAEFIMYVIDNEIESIVTVYSLLRKKKVNFIELNFSFSFF